MKKLFFLMMGLIGTLVCMDNIYVLAERYNQALRDKNWDIAGGPDIVSAKKETAVKRFSKAYSELAKKIERAMQFDGVYKYAVEKDGKKVWKTETFQELLDEIPANRSALGDQSK